MDINKLLRIPKSLYFNLSAFPLKTAIKMPVLVSYKTKLKGIKKNKVIIDAPIKFGLIRKNIFSCVVFYIINYSILLSIYSYFP